MGLFAAAVPAAAVLAGVVTVYKRSWSSDAFFDLFGVVAISILVGGLLVAEVRRQAKCEVSEEGFFTTDWCLRAGYPFIATKCVRHTWEEVEDVGRSGYTMLFKTHAGVKKINLALFQDAESVAEFAMDHWRGRLKAGSSAKS